MSGRTNGTDLDRIENVIQRLQNLNERVDQINAGFNDSPRKPVVIARSLQEPTSPARSLQEPTSPADQRVLAKAVQCTNVTQAFHDPDVMNEPQMWYGPEPETAIQFSDFDIVLQFPNPGLATELDAMIQRQSARRSQTFRDLEKQMSQTDLRRTESQKSKEAEESEKRRKKLREDDEETNNKFKQKLIEREQRRRHLVGEYVSKCEKCGRGQKHEQKGLQYAKIQPAVCPVAGCGGALNEVLTKCLNCGKDGDPDIKACPYCRSTDLLDVCHPIVHKVEEMTPRIFDLYAKQLIRDCFFDPRQGLNLEMGDDITDVDLVRRAVIDMFLSYFRSHEDKKYVTYIFKSVDFDELWLCVKMVEETAKDHAYASGYSMLLNTNKIAKPVDDNGLNIAYSEMNVEEFGMPSGIGSAIQNCLAKFEGEAHGRAINPALNGGPIAYNKYTEHLLETYKHEAFEPHQDAKSSSSCFRKLDVIRLLYDKVTDEIKVQELIENGLMLAFFPLHTKDALMRLKEKWARLDLAYTYIQPLHMIHNYFGENVTLYFLFLQHLLKYTTILVVVCVIFTITELVLEMNDNWELTRGSFILVVGGKAGNPRLRIAWTIFVILWCQVCNIRLKRKFITKCNIWGMDGKGVDSVKSEENPRFFKLASITASELNENELDLTVSWKKKMHGRILSRVGTAAFVIFTTACSMGILLLQAWTMRPQNAERWGFMTSYLSFALTFEIKALQYIWGIVGQMLVDNEYWRDRTHYDNAKALKDFQVHCVTTFVSFYYIAFLMVPTGNPTYQEYGKINGKPSTGPWAYLTYQMLITFGSYLAFSVYDLVEPILTKIRAKRSERKTLEAIGEKDWHYSFIEMQGKFQEYDGDSQNGDYMQILLPLGFCCFFGSTLPLCMVAFYLYTSVQIRVDAWKLCHAMKRPYPRPCDPESWVWGDIVDHFFLIATVTNIGLISLTMEPCASSSAVTKLAVFSSLVVVTYVFNQCMELMYPAVSGLVDLARKRHEYQRGVADRVYKENEKAMPRKLRASKDVRFHHNTGRMRYSGFASANANLGIDRDLVDKIFQEEMPMTFFGTEAKFGSLPNIKRG